MKVFKLIRICSTPEAMFGVLLAEDRPLCLTLERPWKNNEHDVSCVPKGEWLNKRVDSPKFGNTFEMLVTGRDKILYHKGNTFLDSHGCVILGSKFGVVAGVLGVLESAAAFNSFMEELHKENEFKVVISEV